MKTKFTKRDCTMYLKKRVYIGIKRHKNNFSNFFLMIYLKWIFKKLR